MTRRSRSSFDLRDALSTAEALSPKPPSAESKSTEFGGLPLIAFGRDTPSVAPPAAPARVAPPPMVKQSLGPPPDVSGLPGMMPRLSTLLEWVRTDPEVTRVLVVDDEGLPLIGSTTGDLGDAESLLAATGSVASAMKRLALATPGTLSADFEGHVGESPVLQLVGLSAGRAFVVAISRKEPFGPKDVDLLRSTFARALEGTVGGHSVSPKPPRVSGRPSVSAPVRGDGTPSGGDR